MKRIAIATVIAALASALPAANASDGTSCCACIPTGASPPVSALFCAAVPIVESTEPLIEKCLTISHENAKLRCVEHVDNRTCIEQLSEQSVLCPTSPAPAVTPINLATLAVVLGTLGIAVLRRRRA